MRIHLTKAFDAPGPHPNGLQGTTEGLWIIDQGNHIATCQAYENGKILRKHQTAADRASGITDSGAHLWISSTYSCEILKCNRATLETIDSFPAPGAKKTGSHGLEWKDGFLWVTTPPSATIYKMDPATWDVVHSFPAPGDRPHGIAWENEKLWCVETNHRAIYLFDPETGETLDRIEIEGPEPHGFTIWQGVFWIGDANTREVYRGVRTEETR